MVQPRRHHHHHHRHHHQQPKRGWRPTAKQNKKKCVPTTDTRRGRARTGVPHCEHCARQARNAGEGGQAPSFKPKLFDPKGAKRHTHIENSAVFVVHGAFDATQLREQQRGEIGRTRAMTTTTTTNQPTQKKKEKRRTTTKTRKGKKGGVGDISLARATRGSVSNMIMQSCSFAGAASTPRPQRHTPQKKHKNDTTKSRNQTQIRATGLV